MVNYYVADFEATIHPGVTTEEISANRKAYPTEVWLAGLENVYNPRDRAITYSIGDFLENLFTRQSATIFMHNLQRYDARFIIQHLIEKMGYQHLHANQLFTGWKTLLGNRNSFTIYHSQGRVYNFYDSLNLVKGTTKTLGEMTGVVSKGEETPLVEHGKTLEETCKADGSLWTWPEALAYLDGDLGVLAEVCRQLELPAAMDAGIRTQATLAYTSVFTPGGNPVPAYRPGREFRALNTCKGSSKGSGVKKAPTPRANYIDPLSDFDPDNVRLKHMNNSKKLIEQSNRVSRDSYRGGVALANPAHANKWLEKYTTLDVNSMYPFIYSTMALPRYFQGVAKGYKGIVTIEQLRELAEGYKIIKFKYLRARIKGDYIPTIKPRTDAVETRLLYNPDGKGAVNAVYSEEIDYPITLTSIDVRYLLDFYEIEEAEILGAYTYARSGKLEEAFRNHCARWTKAKEEASIQLASGVPGAKVRRYYAKLMLNAPYGKLGQYIRQYPTESYQMTSEGYSEQEAPSRTGGRESADVVTASFITAYGRDMLARAVNRIGYSKVYYVDTDSITLQGHWEVEELEAVGLTVHDTELGAWAIEDKGDSCKFIAPKTYAKEKNGKVQYTMAGYANKDSVIHKEDFKAGMAITDKRAIRADGGTLIATVEKTIADDRKIQLNTRKKMHSEARRMAREIYKRYQGMK